MPPITRQGPFGIPARQYLSRGFSGKAQEANPHPVAKITQQSPFGMPMRRYGSFAGKASAGLGLQPTGIASTLAFGSTTVILANLVVMVGIPSYQTAAHDVTLTITQGTVDPNPTYTNYKISLTGGPDPRSAIVALTTTTYTGFTGVAVGSYTATWQLSNSDGSVTDAGQSRLVSIGSFGLPSLGWGLRPTGIASTAAVGTPLIGGGSGSGLQAIHFDGEPSFGIASTAQLGTPKLGISVANIGNIASTLAFGSFLVNNYLILPGGIASTLAVGSPTVSAFGDIAPNGIGSTLVFGAIDFRAPANPSFGPLLVCPICHQLIVVDKYTPSKCRCNRTKLVRWD